jgi:uncharacterized protein
VLLLQCVQGDLEENGDKELGRELLKIEGMTCQSCVGKVTKAIMGVPGVKDVEVSLSKQSARFKLVDSQTKIEDIVSAIRNAGYEVSQKQAFDWFYFWGFIVLIILMFLSSRLRGYEQALTSAGAGFGLLFLIGLLTSLHCVAMCGGITLSQVSMDGNFRKRYATLIQYHLGRLFSYSLVGLILGALGALAAPNDKIRGIVTLVGGVGMALFALSGIFPRWFSGVRLPNFSAHITSKGIWSRSSLGIGFINGFVPCGPLQGMQFYALASGSAMKGGLSMLIFALGTMPLLFGFGTFFTLINNKFRNRLIKLGFMFVLLLAFMMLMRGIGYIVKKV